AKAGNAFQLLKQFSEVHQDWLFGHFGYDLKNETEDLSSGKPDRIQFPDLFFFVPKNIIRLNADTVSIGTHKNDAAAILENIQSYPPINKEDSTGISINIQQRVSRQAYLDTIRKLQEHIHRGDCYEINYCQEFFAEGVSISPLSVYKKLVNVSPNPFSGFYKLNQLYLMCASPERYLKKMGTQLLSQPIKGTSERNEDSQSDQLSREQLYGSLKERTENVMIVDLVRNDLSRVCKEGSVVVKELFGIYAFPQVYQMISTIIGEMNDGVHWVDAISNSFPMGSMTGAPKKRVMELIEEYEQTRRGIFSGALGYVTPERDFDFNVVIRSIMYNQSTNYLCYQAGSGITYNSEPEIEYAECLVKVEAIKKVLTRSEGQHF
ncbi:MAG TPA: anthranilate synthase component I family protein, partial [Chitinophagaceae bacterium]|nr:anthranilate synthase component I family protein [Chitinophagaceae bacterium]